MKCLSSSLVLAALAGMAAARTDLVGCTSSATVDQWGQAELIWYVSDTGEICDLLDCGGGRAPPRYDVAGCPQYTGTATYVPSYLPGYGPGAKPTAMNPIVTSTVRISCTASTSSIPTVYSTYTTKCSSTKPAMISRPLITPGPSTPFSPSSSAPASSVPLSTAGTGGPSGPSISPNGASVPGYSAAGAIIAVAAFMGVAL